MNLQRIVFLVVFIISINEIFAQIYYPTDKTLIVYSDGSGLLNLKDSLKLDTPAWLNQKVVKNEKLYANGFNGVNFTGLVVVDLNSLKIKAIDLIELGAPSNYISEIFIKNNYIILNILGSYYVYDSIQNKLSNNLDKFINRPLDRTGKYYLSDNITLAYRDSVIYDLEKHRKYLIPINNIGKIIYSDESIVVIQNKSKITFIDIRNSSISLHNLQLNPVGIFKWNDIYIIWNEEESYIYNSFGFSKIPESFGNLNGFNSSSKFAIIKRNNKVYSFRIHNEINPLGTIKLNFADDFFEVIPQLRNNEYLICAKVDNRYITNFSYCNKLNLSNEIPLDQFNIVLIDKNWKYYSSNIPILNSYKYININRFIYIFSVFFFIILIYLFTKQIFFLYPIIILPFLIYLVAIICELVFSIRLISLNIYLILYLILLLICNILVFYSKKIKFGFGEGIEVVHNFGHGNKGLNNLLRLYRITSCNENEGKQYREIFIKSFKEYIKYTSSDLKMLLKVTQNRYSNLIKIITIDYYRVRLKYEMYKLIKKRFKQITPQKIRDINYYILKIINHAETLRKEFYRSKSITLNETLKIISLELKNVHPELKIVTNVNSRRERILIESRELFTVLDNIISNAKEATKVNKRDEIDIKIYWELNYLVIDVLNVGMPIKVKNSDELFSPVYSSKQGGGFGLFQSKKTLQEYLGDIIYEYLEGYNCFKIKLRTVT